VDYAQAIILGLIQGVTELFPVSSLGHSVILPALFGWTNVVQAQSAKESFFLAFLVGLHVATALALAVFYRDQWVRIVKGLIRSLRRRGIETPDERLGWLLVVATIPAGLVGLLLEHPLRVLFATPVAAAGFLVMNGAILFAGELIRRRAVVRTVVAAHDQTASGDRRLYSLEFREAGAVGVAQVFALLAGISRSGITMVAGLVRGLDHEDAARFSFLLATPIILAAGVYKLPDLLGPNGDGVRGQVLAGSMAAGIAAYLSVRFLSRYFTSRTLMPFAAYSVLVGVLALIRFGLLA
jgi:undecaprenyl-diphosphatase